MTSQLVGSDFTGAAQLPNYVNGRLLPAEDLAISQATLRARDRRLGRAAGHGIVDGLWVTSTATTLTVASGLGVAPSGDAVSVGASVTLPLTFTAPASGSSVGGTFASCTPATATGGAAIAAGCYLLTALPACQLTGQAPLASTPGSTAPAGCAAQWQIEGVQFKAIGLPLGSSVLGVPVTDANRRNLLAHWCFGSAALATLGADPFGFTAGYGGLDKLDPADLSSADLPLAVFYWNGQAIGFVDNWSVRRRITAPDPVTASWSGVVSDRRIADGQARLLQFQDQAAELVASGAAGTVAAATTFPLLPPVGFLPVGLQHLSKVFGDMTSAKATDHTAQQIYAKAKEPELYGLAELSGSRQGGEGSRGVDAVLPGTAEPGGPGARYRQRPPHPVRRLHQEAHLVAGHPPPVRHLRIQPLRAGVRPVATSVRVGRLVVRPARAGPGQDLVARQRAESRITSLDLAPHGFTDRAVLVVRRVRWRADRRLPETARADLDDLYRHAGRPGSGQAPDPGAPAVLFADEAELLACLTRDTVAGHLTRWYWRHLAPTGPARIGAVLTVAWTARVRWLPAALAALPAGDAARAVSTLVPREALHVLRALPPEHEALLGVAVMLHAAPVLARRPGFVGQVEAWLRTPTAARPGGPPQPQARLYPDGAPAALPARVVSGARTTVVPDAATTFRPNPPMAPGEVEPVSVEPVSVEPPGRIPVEPTGAVVTGDLATELAAAPTAAPWAGGVPSRFASVLYLVNVLSWLDVPAAWPQGALPSGWAIVELLARHLLTEEAAPRDDPLWTLLAGLDGREPGTVADAGVGANDPLCLPAAWLRRWTPEPASWVWAERQGRLILADEQRGFVVADVPGTAADADRTASAELARLDAAGVPGSMRPGTLPPARPAGAPGPARWSAVVGQFVAWLLASREVTAGALAQPGRIAVTRTHVDVVLDLERIDLAARICGLDRVPGWVPALGRIVAFPFDAGD